MKPVIHKEKSLAIAYDASLMDAPGPEFFSVEHWKSHNAVTGEAIGRGSAWFIDTAVGSVVLRRYLRGGFVAKVSRQSYFFTTVSRSRPVREFMLLASLYALGLPVPKPVAALCEFSGLISSGTIVTVRIPSVRTLADILPTTDVSDNALWKRIGECIRKFHDAGVWHADLNARNILLDMDLEVFLIDFDRARYTPGRRTNGQGNLKRLKRSLTKLWPVGQLPALQTAWSQLELGYDR